MVFLFSIAPGPSFRFSTNLVKDVTKRFLLILWNSYNYFVTYANLNGFEPGKTKNQNSILDKWAIIKLQDVVNKVTEDLDNYDLYNATHEIEDFVSRDFSQWYIRRSRGRIDSEFLQTLHEILVTICKLTAPFAPFISEEIYKNLSKEESVHLSDWPEKKILGDSDTKILEEMEEVRKVVEKGHALRKEAGIPLRQPLGQFQISNFKFQIEPYVELLEDELNIKEVIKGNKIKLDTNITPELKAEGEMRGLVRRIQEERKKLGTRLDEKVDVQLPSWPKEFEEEIRKRALVSKITKGEFKVKR